MAVERRTVDHDRPSPGAPTGTRRLVVVSNRVPTPGPNADRAGGLVSALLPALEQSGGLWFGWSGRAGTAEGRARVARSRDVDFVTIDLTRYEITRYYAGFSNRTLWPAMHGIRHRRRIGERFDYLAWRAVNRRLASHLAPLLRPDDLVFVHDYHLIPFGRELRLAGWGGLLGYFHHVPVPPREIWEQLPHADAIAEAFVHYDLAGVQTERDRAHLQAIVGDAASCAIEAHPIGIDAAGMRAMAALHPDDTFARIRGDRRVFFGVDRLDYTKGIPARLVAFEQLLERHPELAPRVRFVQWAAPTRESIDEYRSERAAVEALARRIARRHQHDAPLALSVADRPRSIVAAALRDADVCVVTSLADGMNLVAKEFVAVQRPEAPGVLVLSDTCGAAEELTDALIVHAADVSSIEAAFERALDMPLEERRRRWRSMLRAVESNTVQHWLAGYLESLRAAQPEPVSSSQAARGA